MSVSFTDGEIAQVDGDRKRVRSPIEGVELVHLLSDKCRRVAPIVCGCSALAIDIQASRWLAVMNASEKSIEHGFRFRAGRGCDPALLLS